MYIQYSVLLLNMKQQTTKKILYLGGDSLSATILLVSMLYFLCRVHFHIVYYLSLGACVRITVVILCVYLCVCMCVCYSAGSYIPGLYVQSEVVSCRSLKICIVWTLLKTFRLGDVFACHDD